MSRMMEYNGYHAVIEFNGEDRLFIGTVFGINDSLYFHGESIKELENNFHQCIDNYLAICEEFNKTPDKEFKGSFNVRISPELHKKLAFRAADSGKKLNQCIVEAVENYLEEREKDIVICIPYPEKIYSINNVYNDKSYNNVIPLIKERREINAKF